MNEVSNNKIIYLEITSKEDEKRWKEFLSFYFPNHYAKGILDTDLVIENPDIGHYSKRIGVSVDGYGYLSSMCLHYGPKEQFQYVDNFIEFMNTDVYHSIIDNGPKLTSGSPEIIGCKM